MKSSTENSAIQEMNAQQDKKRTFSEFSESNQEGSHNQDSERKRRKQLQPIKLDNSDEKKSLKDNIRTQGGQNINKTQGAGQQQQQQLFTQGQSKPNVKSFKMMKEQQKQQQVGANYDSFFGISQNQNAVQSTAKVIPNNRVQQTANNIKTNKSSIEHQNKLAYQQSQFQPADIDDENEMIVDQEQSNTLLNRGKKQQKEKNGHNKNTVTLDQQQQNNLNVQFSENLNLKSINDIDQLLLKQNEANKHQKKAIADQLKYINLQELPKDFSLKTSIDISCMIKSESEPINLDYSKLQKYLQYYVYSTDQRLSGFDKLIDRDQVQLQQKIQWLRSFRDAYLKFLQSATSNENSMKGVDMPYFYVKNNSFIALFKIEDGKPSAIVNPSKTLAKIIQDANVIKTVVNISHDEDEEREHEQQRQQQLQQQQQKSKLQKDEDSEDEKIDDQDRLTFLLDDNNHQNEHFNLVVKNQSQLYYFESKAVQSIYNIIANYIANQLDQQQHFQSISQSAAFSQIIAPQPFINCTYNEGQLFYQGNVAYTNKQVKYQMKLFGIFFPANFNNLCQILRSQVRCTSSSNVQTSQSQQQNQNQQQITEQQCDDNNREIDIHMHTDDQSMLFSYKKCIKHIKVNTNGFQVKSSGIGSSSSSNGNNQGNGNQSHSSSGQTVQYKIMFE